MNIIRITFQLAAIIYLGGLGFVYLAQEIARAYFPHSKLAGKFE